MTKCDTRCSTTSTGFTTGRRISAPSPSCVGMMRSSVLYSVRESVCTGACQKSISISEYEQQGRVRYLRNKAIWEGDADNPADESSASQEEKVPVEASWLFQWEISRLCSQTADVLREVSPSRGLIVGDMRGHSRKAGRSRSQKARRRRSTLHLDPRRESTTAAAE